MSLTEKNILPIHFIIAIPRTGSTLLHTMLSQHRNVISILEEPFYLSLYDKYSNVGFWTSKLISEYVEDFYLFSNHKSILQMPTKSDLIENLRSNINNLNWDLVVQLTFNSFQTNSSKTDASCIICKELSIHNHIIELSVRYPKSKFIFLYRNPLDNIARWRNFREKRLKKSEKISDIATRWNYRNEKTISAKKNIDKSRILNLKYISLIQNPEQVLQNICNFLDLEYTDSLMGYSENVKKSIESLGHKNEYYVDNFNEFHSGLLTKPNSAKIDTWKKDLSSIEAATAWEICANTACKLGYQKPDEIISDEISLPIQKNKFLIFKNKLTVKLWTSSPFWLRKRVKKLKYGAFVEKYYNNKE